MFMLRLILISSLAVSATALSAQSNKPDEVLLNRAMSGMISGRYDVAVLSLQVLMNSYPDSPLAKEASILIQDPRIPVCSSDRSSGCRSEVTTNEDAQHTQFVRALLLESQAIKSRMTRSELEKTFTAEGGLSFGRQRTYVSRRCPIFKIDVKFTSLSNDDGPDDEIVKVSTPYIAWTIAD